MKEPRTALPLNDETDYGLCFACGPRHPSGLLLRFERVGDTVTTSLVPRAEHQGFPGYLHGGVITVLLDEAMSRVSLLDGRWTLTARLEVKFRRPVLIGQRVTAVAELSKGHGRSVETSGRVELPDGVVAAEATGTYVYVPPETLADMTAPYPGLASEWMKG
jgi:uncharacterized protein (TIGR00369 family)